MGFFNINGFNVECVLGLYSQKSISGEEVPGIAIQLVTDCGELFGTATVSFGEEVEKNCAYLDINNCSYIKEFFDSLGVIEDTGIVKLSGYCTYPLVRFKERFLIEIDIYNLYPSYIEKITNKKTEHLISIDEAYMPEFIGQIIDTFEDFLEEKRISIKNKAKENEYNPAVIYGEDYDKLYEEIMVQLKNWETT